MQIPPQQQEEQQEQQEEQQEQQEEQEQQEGLGIGGALLSLLLHTMQQTMQPIAIECAVVFSTSSVNDQPEGVFRVVVNKSMHVGCFANLIAEQCRNEGVVPQETGEMAVGFFTLQDGSLTPVTSNSFENVVEDFPTVNSMVAVLHLPEVEDDEGELEQQQQ